MSDPAFDLVTVGGGLASSALAYAMATRGARVLVVEREAKFHDRVRGEYLSPWGVAEAKALGLLDLLCTKCASILPWADPGSGPRNVVETTPQQLPGISFFHPEMQEALLTAAAEAGADVRRGTTVQGVEPGKHPAIRIGTNGTAERIAARLIVAADGRGSAVRKWAGFALQRNAQPFLFAGVRLGDVEARTDMMQFFFNPEFGTVAALAPQGAGMFRAYLGHPTDARYRLQGNENLAIFLQETARVAPPYAGYFMRAKAQGPLASFDAGDSWVEHPYRDGVALLGDAAATSDPSFGQGMALALRAARTLRDELTADPEWDRAGQRYAERCDTAFQSILRATSWFRAVFQEQGPAADARRQKALPRIMQDPTRVPDHLFSGPELPSDDSVRARFFGEI